MQRTTETFKLLLGKRKGNNKGNSLSTCLRPTILLKACFFSGFSGLWDVVIAAVIWQRAAVGWVSRGVRMPFLS